MSKYSKLLGLVREVLPTGEKMLVKEGDDLIHGLHGLDERIIENAVSQMDAADRATKLRKSIEKKVIGDSLPINERRYMRDDMSRDFQAWDTPDKTRDVGGWYFNPKYDEHLNLDELRDLSKQDKDTFSDLLKAKAEKNELKRNLQQLNPDFDSSELSNLFDNDHLDSYVTFDPKTDKPIDTIARQRFKKIRDAMKEAMKASKE